jgi:hypothetical protein
MRSAVLVLVAALVGCSTDASGLGGDFVLADATVDDTTTSGNAETSPLFPDDEGVAPVDSTIESDSATPPDTEVPDTASPDTEIPDTYLPDTDMPDTPDTSIVMEDVAPETIVIDAPPSDGALSPTPGAVTCSDKVCAAGQDCCGTSGGFECASSCSTFASKFRCDEKTDCPSGQICCAEVTPFVGSWYGTICRSPEWCGTAQVCTSSAQCSSGKVCTPIKPSGAPTTMGYCK